MRVPFNDLVQQYRSGLSEHILNNIQDCMETAEYIGGRFCMKFQKELAEFLGGGEVALCNSGTDALYLSILATLGRGDGVSRTIMTVANSFVATAEAIVWAGYIPEFIDIDPETGLMDLSNVHVHDRLAAVIPVHLYGAMVDVKTLYDQLYGTGVVIIEDACQSIGATFNGDGIGRYSSAAALSFYPGKNLGAYGDGGAVYSARDSSTVARVKVLANHGSTEKYDHFCLGMNSRLDNIQAAILCAKLPYLRLWTQRRREIARRYTDGLFGTQLYTLPKWRDGAQDVWHVYAIRTTHRNEVRAFLSARGIETGVHYPTPIHRQSPYRVYVPHRLPHTEQWCDTTLSLPIYPEMTDKQVYYVVTALQQFELDVLSRLKSEDS